MLDADLIVSEDLDRFLRALDEFPRQMDHFMLPVVRQGAELLRGEVAEYPPSSGANTPPGLNGYSWYERGFGTRTRTGRAYPTSQALGRSWTTEAKSTGTGWVGATGTNVSYAPAVQGVKQAPIHAMRGWPRADKVLKAKTNDLIVLVHQGIDRALEWLVRR